MYSKSIKLIKWFVYSMTVWVYLSGCQSESDKRLNFALKLAGGNRHELEEVLEHYKNDTLKLKAARFLIENMPFHNYQSYGKTEDLLNELQTRMENANASTKTMHELIYDKNLFSSLDPTIKNDAQTITAPYLIKNIDLAFYTWEKQPWGKHVTFDLFCREILPYRIGNETPDNWREIYYRHFQPFLDSSLTNNDPALACKIIHKSLVKDKWIFMSNLAGPRVGGEILLKYRLGNCREYSDLLTYAMRAVGILGGTDIILQNPDKSTQKHYWNYVKDTTGRSLEYELYKSSPTVGYRDTTRKKGVIYRSYYDIQPTSIMISHPGKDIPETLKNPFIKYVSEEYFPGSDIKIKLKDRKDDLLYLCVFNNSQWIPIAGTEIKNDSALFKGVEPGIVYLSAYYINQELIPVACPFLLKKDKKLHYWEPDITHTISVALERKYPPKELWYDSTSVINGKFEGSNHPDFRNAINLYTIKKDVKQKFNEVKSCSPQPFRYVRYISPGAAFNLMAEVEFYNEKQELLKGEVLGTEDLEGFNPTLTKKAVFDGDPLTFFRVKSVHKSWAGLDLGEKQTIDKIRFIFRNDDNQIREGELYELFYFDGHGYPVSVGKQTGDKQQILFYNNIPTNALLWLRNLTKGKEERIFTYEKEKQIWW